MSNSNGALGRLWGFLRIMNVRLRFVFLMVLTGLIAANWESITNHWDRWTRPGSATVGQQAGEYEYYCPMHPSVVRGEPGNCPICGMPLTRRMKEEAPSLPEGTLARVQLSPYRMQLAGIATSEVTMHPIQREVRAVGTIEVDERKIAGIAARTGGRVERLYVSYTGEKVGKGDPLVDLYSPDLVSTQKEYLLAVRNREVLGPGPPTGGAPAADAPLNGAPATGTSATGAPARVLADAQSLLDAARDRLLLWGIDDEQISEIRNRGAASERLTIRSPVTGTVVRKNVAAGQYVGEGSEMYAVADLSRVWMIASVYEEDVSRVAAGQRVEVSADALPGRTFEGEVSFVWPMVDQATRSLRVRMDVENSDGALRPGMFVNARITTGRGTSETAGTGGGTGPATGTGATASRSAPAAAADWTCPMDPQVHSDHPGQCPICGMNLVKVERTPEGYALAVPESAVIDTGTRKIVYLEREPGVFDAVEVSLGPRADGYYPVLAGLTPGDRVVTAGAFLVDAEGRLNPGVASTYFGASGGPSKSQ